MVNKLDRLSINKDNLLEKLLKEVPEFKKIHSKEKEYHDIGVHLVFGDLFRLAEESFEKNNTQVLSKIANFLNKCYLYGNKDIKNAVFV